MIHDIFFVPINFSDSLPRVITSSLSSKSLHTTGLGLIPENLAEATMHLYTENRQISDFLLVLFLLQEAPLYLITIWVLRQNLIQKARSPLTIKFFMRLSL